MKFQVLAEANGEAIAAASWYDEHRPGLGDEFLTELPGVISILATRKSQRIGDFLEDTIVVRDSLPNPIAEQLPVNH